MGRTSAKLPSGVRISDHVSLGVIARTFPLGEVRQVLAQSGRSSARERDLPAHVMVYYVIALALYMGSSMREVLRCLLDGLRALWGPAAVKVAGKSAISQARRRLGEEPLRDLYERLVRPIATPATRGAWYRGWRLVSLDGSTLDVADSAANEAGFGRPGSGRGPGAFPQLRLVSLLENGTHVLFGACLGRYTEGESTLARTVLGALRPGMLCLADRQFFSHALWRQAIATGADLLWRVKCDLRLPCEQALADGSYLTTLYLSATERRRRQNGVRVRVIEYRLSGSGELYRLITTVLDPQAAPAEELAALYHERWEIEGTLAEFKTHLRGARMVLRSQTPALVRQEVWGLLLAHYAVRGLMHEAALQADEDPDRLSFLHAVRVIRRQVPRFAALPPSAPCRPAPPGAGRNSGRTCAKQPRPAEPARRQTQAERLQGAAPFPQSNHQGRVCREHTGA
jgi:Insertion element 4 transposase N-terminal/Transposase DDE domain